MNKISKKEIISQVITSLAVNSLTTLATETVKLISGQFMAKIEIPESSNYFDKFINTIYDLDPVAFSKFELPSRQTRGMHRLNINSSYIIKFDRFNYGRVKYYEDKDAVGDYRNGSKILSLDIYGNNCFSIRAKLIQKIVYSNINKDRILLNSNDINTYIIPHEFDDLIIDDEIKKRIYNGLTNWNNSKDWYKEHNLVHKIGVLLYGPPGTGKSMMVRSISHMFNNCPIVSINKKIDGNTIWNINDLRESTNLPIIVLLEDFDLIFENRDDEDEDGPRFVVRRDPGVPDQNIVFQILDGIFSTEDTIYIATTNHKDKLDNALIRYGRFDIQEKLDYFNEDFALKMVKKFGYDKTLLDSFNLSYPVQPAHLQSLIMEHRSKEFLK